jgi:hypothetical protein
MKGLLIIAALGVAALRQEPSVEQLIERLRSDSISEREQAAKQLRNRGPAAIPDLERALTDKDPELVLRVRPLLEAAREDVRLQALQVENNRGMRLLARIQESAIAAGGLRIVCTVAARSEGHSGSGIAFCKDGKFSVRSEIETPENRVKDSLVSDGSTLGAVARSPALNRAARMPLTPELKQALDRILGQGGVLIAAQAYRSSLFEGSAAKADLEGLVLVDSFLEGEDGNEKWVDYTLRCPPERIRAGFRNARVHLVYDGESYRPLQRTFEFIEPAFNPFRETPSRLWTATEDYSRDGPIPDDAFVVPEEKK